MVPQQEVMRSVLRRDNALLSNQPGFNQDAGFRPRVQSPNPVLEWCSQLLKGRECRRSELSRSAALSRSLHHKYQLSFFQAVCVRRRNTSALNKFA